MAKIQSPIKTYSYLLMTKPSKPSTVQWDCEPEACWCCSKTTTTTSKQSAWRSKVWRKYKCTKPKCSA